MTNRFRIVVGSIMAALSIIVIFMLVTLFKQISVENNTKPVVHQNWEYQLIIDTSDVMVYQGYRLVGRVKYSDIGKLDSILRTDSKEISSLIKPRK